MITLEKELDNSIYIWQQKTAREKPQVIEEIASSIQESNHTPDYYFYDFDLDGDLCSPVSGKKIKDIIKRDNFIQKMEGLLIDSLDDEIKKGHSRFAWISAPCSGVYTDMKLVVSEVIQSEGKKRFLNRSFLYDFNAEQSWKVAQEMAKISLNKDQISSLDVVRKTPLILDPAQDWITYLAETINKPYLIKFIKAGEDCFLKQLALKDASRFYEQIIKQPSIEVRVDPGEYGFGDYPSSCPLEIGYGGGEMFYRFNLVYINSLDIVNKWYCKKCPVCNQEINTIVRPGQRCPKGNCMAERKCS